MSLPQRRITGGTVDRCCTGEQMRVDGARGQSAIDPVACLVELAVSVKRPGERRLSGEILPRRKSARAQTIAAAPSLATSA